MTEATSESARRLALQGVRCVAFDAVGTLIRPVPTAADVYHRVAREAGSRLSANEITSRFREAFRASEADDLAAAGLRTDEAHEHERWRKIVRTVIDDVKNVDDCFEQLFAHFAKPSSWSVYDDVGEALARLAAAGLRLAVASNFDDRLEAVCDGLPELRPIEVRVISSQVGCRKPGDAFYQALLARTGCRADELLMIGDDFENDIAGAWRLGIRTLWLRRGESPSPDDDWIGDLHGLADAFAPTNRHGRPS